VATKITGWMWVCAALLLGSGCGGAPGPKNTGSLGTVEQKEEDTGSCDGNGGFDHCDVYSYGQCVVCYCADGTNYKNTCNVT
jgi:hypothetical protein